MTPEDIIATLQDELTAAREELKSTRDMFQLAMDSIPCCIWWKDTEGRYLGVNKNLAVAAGKQSVGEMIGKSGCDVWTPEDALKYRLDDERVMSNGQGEYGIIETQRRIDGTVCYLETNKVPLRDTSGKVVGTLGTFQDVTARQQMEEELRHHRNGLERLVEERTHKLAVEVQERQTAQDLLARKADELALANQALREAEQTKSAFFANVSHELRTPLTLILAPLESAIAGSYGELDGEMDATLRTVHSSAVRLLELVNSILDISRLDAGGLKAYPVACSLDSFLRNILRDFVGLARKRSQTLHWELACDDDRLVDPYLLERIVFNLVSNALKFTSVGGRIEVRAWVEDDQLNLVVSDDGIGIALDEQPNLFRKFHQVESSYNRRYEGTGLGLAMVREFARLCGGEVEMVSVSGQGSTFTVQFPALPAQHPAEELSRDRRVLAWSSLTWSEGPPSGGPDILVAEDNEELALYVAKLLQPFGQVRWAGDGELAMQMARDRKPALIVSDVMMANRDGMWLCRQIRQEFPEEPPPVILLTALSDRKALLDGWEAGAADFLHKPFHPLELTTRVRTLLEARSARMASAEERRNLEERLFQAQKLDSLGMMAGGIAHDFNNLLAIVTGQLELAEHSSDLPRSIALCLKEAASAAARAAGLSKQMLTYAGKATFSKVRTDLAQLTKDTAEMLERCLIPKPIVKMELSAAWLDGDESQIGQVILNLLTNGAESVPADRKPILHVQTGAREFSAEFLEQDQAGFYAFLRVEDNGSGMTPEVRKRIFDPFFSTKFVGRGLGMAAVQGILQTHSGKCRIFSEPGGGTTFWVLFPSSNTPAESRPLPATGLPWRGHGTVLIVDDDDAVRKMLARMLTLSGFEVLQANCGQQALEIMGREKERIRGALLDVIMPDLGGPELGRALRNICPDLPCLLCSGFRGNAVGDGNFKVLGKPFKMAELQDAMQRLLDTPNLPFVV